MGIRSCFHAKNHSKVQRVFNLRRPKRFSNDHSSADSTPIISQKHSRSTEPVEMIHTNWMAITALAKISVCKDFPKYPTSAKISTFANNNNNRKWPFSILNILSLFKTTKRKQSEEMARRKVGERLSEFSSYNNAARIGKRWQTNHDCAPKDLLNTSFSNVRTIIG